MTVVCDVREDLRNGQEPFSKIMAAVSDLGPQDQLALYAIFEPVPLYRVLGKMGFEYTTEQLGPSDWKITFFRPQT